MLLTQINQQIRDRKVGLIVSQLRDMDRLDRSLTYIKGLYNSQKVWRQKN